MLSVASLSLAPVSYGMEEDYMLLDLDHYKKSIFSEEFNFERFNASICKTFNLIGNIKNSVKQYNVNYRTEYVMTRNFKEEFCYYHEKYGTKYPMYARNNMLKAVSFLNSIIEKSKKTSDLDQNGLTDFQYNQYEALTYNIQHFLDFNNLNMIYLHRKLSTPGNKLDNFLSQE